jgi:hypothetical protein
MTRLMFSAAAHRYWLLDRTGNKKQQIPSVTTLLNQLAKPALVRWAARVAGEFAGDHWDDLAAKPISERVRLIGSAPEEARNKSAATGTQIHMWAEALLKGEPVEIPPEHMDTVTGFASWWERSKFTSLATERQVWTEGDDLDGCSFAGTFDLLAEHPEHGHALLDHKTGSGVYGDFGIQLAAYSDARWHVIADEDIPAPRIDTLGIIHIRPDGTALHLLDDEQRHVASERFAVLRMLRTLDDPRFRQVAL